MAITINGTGSITGISAGGLPDGVIATDDIAAAAVTPAKLSQPFSSGTAVASTSGTAIDFTSIPSWVKRITVVFNNVSLSGSAHFLVQIGSGSFSTSSYASGSGVAFGTNQVLTTNSTAGHVIFGSSTSNLFIGTMQLVLLTGTTWTQSHIGTLASGNTGGGGISPSLSGALDRVRITSTSTDTFDAGTVNILYE